MSTTDNGSQSLVFDFKQEGTSQGFNKLLYKILPSGILSGGTLTRVTDASVTISPMVCMVPDSSKSVLVRLETTTNATVAVTPSAPFIVGRFSWLNIESNYMDFVSTSYSDMQSGDIILGKCIFVDRKSTRLNSSH